MARPLLLEQLEKDYPEKEKRKSGPKESVKPIPLAAAFLTPFGDLFFWNNWKKIIQKRKKEKAAQKNQ